MKVLHVVANPKPMDESVSKQVAMAFFKKLMSLTTDVEVENVDLDAEPPPHYGIDQYRSCWYPSMVEGYVPSKEEEDAAKYAKEQAEIFNHADVLMLTMPMWNFSVPSVMKAWIDQVVCPGLTYTIDGDERKPLHKIKRLILVVSSDEAFKEGDTRDALTPVIENVFSSIGIDDICLAWADGQNRNKYQDSADRLALALEAIEEHAEEVAEAQNQE